jgi:hypothetical protein
VLKYEGNVNENENDFSQKKLKKYEFMRISLNTKM